MVVRLSTGVPADLGDPLLNMWIMKWNAHRSRSPTRIGMRRRLRYRGHWLVGDAAWPHVVHDALQWLGASPSPPTTCAIAEPVLNGLSAYWLCWIDRAS